MNAITKFKSGFLFITSHVYTSLTLGIFAFSMSVLFEYGNMKIERMQKEYLKDELRVVRKEKADLMRDYYKLMKQHNRLKKQLGNDSINAKF